MFRFIVKFVCFAFMMFAVDRLIGIGLDYCVNEGASETSSKYVMDEVKQDVLVFGSSRAYRHYDTRVIADSLGISCYNCGQSGQGFIHNYVLLRALLERYTPKLIIYDIYPPADFIIGDNTRYITEIRPFRNRDGVLSVLKDVDSTEEFKTLSSMYCYNHICNGILLHYFIPKSRESSFNGFVATRKEFNPDRVMDWMEEGDIDPLKLKYADLFIQLASKSNLVLSMSPYWDEIDPRYVETARELAEQYGLSFLDFSSNEAFIHNNDYFFDTIHLNDKGAERFTKEFVKQIAY